LEIRARINLEVAKFKTNAKVAGASFRVIASSAKISTDKIDGYLKSSAAKRLAQIKRTEAQEIESARRKSKILSKVEQEKYRNRGGITPGTNVGRNLGLEEKKIARITQMSAKERAKYERDLAKEFKRLQKEKGAASRAFVKRNQADEKRYNNWLRSTNRTSAREYTAFWRQALREKAALERKNKSEVNAVQKNLRNRYREESKAYVQFWKEALKRKVDEEKKAARESKKIPSDFFNSDKFERGMAAARYALYDISRRAIAFGAAVGGAMALATREAIKFQSAFTSVERTTQLSLQSNIPEVRAEAEALRASLIQLSLDMPVAFEDVAQVATLGAQLGIAADAVDAFSETVIRFSAITGISVDEVGLSFGRLAQLLDVPVSKFENLSSAIVFTGINSVATDREILRMAESIGAAGYQAGLSSDEVVGFSAALASLKVRPEEARGVFTRLFRTFDVEASLASEKMDKFAAMMGRTTDEAISLYKSDPTEFFKQFLYGANATGELNVAMRDLGIRNVRELNVISRLAGSMNVLEDALSDSREQYLLGSYSAEAYGQVVDDVASRITIMQNSITVLSAAFGDVLAPIVSQVADGLAYVSQVISNFSTPAKVVIMAIAGITAAAALLFGTLAAGIAGLLALRLAFKYLADDTIKAGINLRTFMALAKSMVGSTAAASGGITGMGIAARVAGGSFQFLGMTIRTLPLIGWALTLATLVPLMFEFGRASKEMSKDMSSIGEAAVEANGGISEAMEAIATDTEKGTEELNRFTIAMTDEEREARRVKKALLETAEAHEELTSQVDRRSGSQEDSVEPYEKVTAVIEAQNAALETNAGLTSEGVEADGDKIALLGEEYVKWLARGARNYAKGEGETGDLLLELVQLGPGVEAGLKELGFDYMEMYNEAVVDAAGDGTGAQAYVDAFDEKLKSLVIDLQVLEIRAPEGTAFSEIISQGIEQGIVDVDTAKVLEDMFDESGLSSTEFLKSLGEIPNSFDAVALSADSANVYIQDKATADAMERNANSAAGLSEEIEGTEEEVISLVEAFKELMDSMYGAQLAENKAADALDTLIQGAEGTSGAMFGLTQSARENFGNFVSFITDAVDAAEAAGEGGIGAVDRIVDALTSMGDAGLDTGEAFKVARVAIVESLVASNDAFLGIKDELSSATDLKGLRDIINGFYTARLAAEGWSSTLYLEWQSVIGVLTAGSSRYEAGQNTIRTSTAKTLTALEKLQAALKKLFSWTNKRMDLQDSINSLGDSLKENGNTFSIWSESGRENVGALLDTIDNMAVSSNGNMQLFANQLGAMRQALVKVGAPASALKYIDDALKTTGKSAKVSTKEVDNFYRELSDNGDAKRSLRDVASAVGEVQSAIKSGIAAYFAQQNAIDDITLGWLDMADASQAAQDAIENASESIDDARQAIREANAEIQNLTAKSKTLEYQLGIAIKYGDTIRADELRAEIASINSDIASQQDNIADSNRDIADSQADIAEANGRLGIGSTTRQIIDQNRALEEMASKYGAAAAWMLTTAEEGTDLNEIIDDQTEEFYQNALQMGYTEEKAREVADVLRDELIASLDKVPEDITTDISAETSAALSKVEKFAKDANARLNTIRDKTITVTTIYQSGGGSAVGVIRRASGGLVTGPGSSTSDSIAARLSNGEYVVKASAVSHYGVDFFNALNQMQTPPASMGTVSVSGGGSQTVYLSPEDRQLLRQAIDRPVALYTDNTTIAKSANAGNQILAQRGIR